MTATRPSMPERSAVLSVCRELRSVCGDDRLGNPEDPLDDLIYIVISNKTAPAVATRTYSALKQRFAAWANLLDAPITTVRAIMRPAGLAGVKTRQLRAALKCIRQDFGEVSLIRLRACSSREQLTYLTSLPGVSDKVARCVMMYTLGAKVLPVDAHVHRLARRLGWTDRKRADQCHAELEALIPPARRFVFHVGAIIHGRAVCRPRNPRCAECRLRLYCPTAASKTP